ncbi:hypothetical protein EF405_03940 [Cyclobacteriaceae bacterium YHN15]|nr:hypothetical protein EF405_03940 [Cyclobacteriaceae bacterium YHN15]
MSPIGNLQFVVINNFLHPFRYYCLLVKKLEVMEYGDPKLGIEKQEQTKEEVQEEANTSIDPKKKALSRFHSLRRDNPVSYKGLFMGLFVGATHVVLKDPYIRLSYQMRNFIEFCRFIDSSTERRRPRGKGSLGS